MKKQKIFVSVGMRGRDVESIAEDIVRAHENLGNDDIEFVENLIDIPAGEGRLYGLGEAIKKIGDCSGVAFCYGWQSYSGCVVEHLVAELYGLDIYEEDSDRHWNEVRPRPIEDRYVVSSNLDDFSKFMNPPIEGKED